jgi:hypothetical protein
MLQQLTATGILPVVFGAPAFYMCTNSGNLSVICAHINKRAFFGFCRKMQMGS